MTAVQMVVWHGTEAEGVELTHALAHNCTCESDEAGMRISVCPAHAALVHDQRWLDGLVFERRRWAAHWPNASKRVIRA